MRVLFIYKLQQPAKGYIHDNYTHSAVCVGVAHTVFTMPLTEHQAELIEIVGSCGSIHSEKAFAGYTDAEIRTIGERILKEEGNSSFDLGEVISNAIDEIEESHKANIEENGKNGINQADEYETIQ